jgi:hypothetical protein
LPVLAVVGGAEKPRGRACSVFATVPAGEVSVRMCIGATVFRSIVSKTA